MRRKKPPSGCLVCSILTSTWISLTPTFFLSFHFAPPLPRGCFTLPRLLALGFLSGFASQYHLIPISHCAKPPRVTGNSITVEDALSFESSTRLVDSNHLAEPQQHRQAVAEEDHTLSFAELKALIEQGETGGIPNNKPIPNTLNVSTPYSLESVDPALSLGWSRTLHQTMILDRSEGNHGKHNPHPFLAVIILSTNCGMMTTTGWTAQPNSQSRSGLLLCRGSRSPTSLLCRVSSRSFILLRLLPSSLRRRQIFAEQRRSLRTISSSSFFLASSSAFFFSSSSLAFKF